jgi:hypothetical protein
MKYITSGVFRFIFLHGLELALLFQLLVPGGPDAVSKKVHDYIQLVCCLLDQDHIL